MWRMCGKPKMMLIFIAVACLCVIARDHTRVEIAPDVFMPVVNHGSGNQTLWVEIGGRGIDTAYDYDYANQQNVAKAVQSRLVSRSDVFITTKILCCPSGFWSYGANHCADSSINIGSPEEQIAKALQLEGVDSVDLLLMHWPCDKLEDSVRVYKVMETALANGMTRAIGVSNFNASALDALIKRTSIKPAVTQNQYSIGNHFNSYFGNDDETWEYCKQQGIRICAWSPLGGASGRGSNIFSNEIVRAIADSHKKSVAQIAFRWLVQRGVLPVTSGENPDHMRQNLDIFSFDLTDNEMAQLSAIGAEPTVLYM